MKEFRRVILLMLAGIWIIGGSLAEDFDLSGYSLEELQIMQDRIQQRISELETQDAMENSNRRIEFAQDELLMYVHQKQKMEISIVRRAEDAPAETSLLWESEDPAIATVSNGWISALSPGETVITARAKDEESIQASIRVQVVSAISSVSLEPARLELVLGAQESQRAAKLTAQISPADAAYPDLIWTSSDENIVTVDQEGNLQAVRAGRATITAQAEDPASRQPRKTTCSVTVLQAVTDITIKEKHLELGTRQTVRLTPSVLPGDASSSALQWTSSDPDVASVSTNGQVRANQPGTCVITCSAADGYGASDSCTITVLRQITKITDANGTRGPIGIRTGGTATLAVRIEPEDATNQHLQWTISDESIAEIARDEDHTITIRGKAKGRATLTGEATDGSGRSIEYTIAVEDDCTVECTGTVDTGVSYGYNWFSLEFTNTSVSRVADGITIQYYAEDVYGEKIKSYGLGDYEVETTFNLTIGPGATRTSPQEIIYGFNQAKTIYAAIVKMHYQDGETVVIEKPEYISFALSE